MNSLSKYFLWTVGAAIIIFLAWYFKSVLIYILVAAVISLIGKPLVNALKKIQIKNWKFPSWLASLLTIFVILTVFFSIFLIITPIIGKISHQVSQLDYASLESGIMVPLAEINDFLIRTFPDVGENFRIELFLLAKLKEIFNLSLFSNIVNSLATFIIDFSIAIFSISFISFFFLMDDGTLTKVILAVFPDKYKEQIERVSASISKLLTRYFLGITVESLGITVLNGLGLVFIAGFDTSTGIILAFLTGILNVIPYVGPLAGHILALITGSFMYIGSGIGFSFPMFLLITFAITMTTQLIDNYVFQPIIYSSSVKAHPLEIFIIILLAAHMAGTIGMLVAVPAYTVIRIIAAEFLSQFKIVKELTKNL